MMMNNHDLREKVLIWARENAQEDFYYGTPYSFCRRALINEVITQDEFDTLQIMYGNLWLYRGD